MATLSTCLLAAAIFAQAAAGSEQPRAADGAATTPADEYLADAKAYVITLQGPKEERLEFAAQPLLHWGNPARNSEDGAVFVWLRAGRPEVIGSIFEYPVRDQFIRKHALHSLSDRPIAAKFGEIEVWSPQAAGVKFSAVPGADPPAENARRRLSQMRDLARQFAVEMVDFRGEKSDLRLMPQPLIRYEPTAGAASDGAIFAFAVGTDPEALLLLESRRAGDTPRWEYAFGRFHFAQLSAQHQGQPVWHVDLDRDMMRTVFGQNDPQREKVYYSVIKPK